MRSVVQCTDCLSTPHSFLAVCARACSIVSSPYQTRRDGVVTFAVKSMGPGTWSHKLCQLVSGSDSSTGIGRATSAGATSTALDASAAASGNERVHLDGPFGGLLHAIDGHRHVVLVAGKTHFTGTILKNVTFMHMRVTVCCPRYDLPSFRFATS